jgi:23S rRNA (adenine2030-N6)-methyltransferase
MNYRHAFHAGNFADVLKHIVLCRVLAHLHGKPTAFRVIDTHAGGGLYDMSGPEATRSGEWRDGIGRVRAARFTGEVAALLAPYLDAVAACNPGAELIRYPGSTALARAFLRPRDRLIACEVAPDAAASLAHALSGDARCKVMRIDGWTALRAQVPPKERRGLVLVDPPFEQPDDFVRLRDGIAAAHRKWATGILILWYPVKDRTGPDLLAKGLPQLGVEKSLRIELTGGPPAAPGRLHRCGLIVVNPPWTLERDLSVLLPALAGCLSSGRSGAHRVDWLAPEKSRPR